MTIDYTFEVKGKFRKFAFDIPQMQVEGWLLRNKKATSRELALMHYDEFLDLCKENEGELANYFRQEAYEECYDKYISPEELYGV